MFILPYPTIVLFLQFSGASCLHDFDTAAVHAVILLLPTICCCCDYGDGGKACTFACVLYSYSCYSVTTFHTILLPVRIGRFPMPWWRCRRRSAHRTAPARVALALPSLRCRTYHVVAGVVGRCPSARGGAPTALYRFVERFTCLARAATTARGTDFQCALWALFVAAAWRRSPLQNISRFPTSSTCGFGAAFPLLPYARACCDTTLTLQPLFLPVRGYTAHAIPHTIPHHLKQTKLPDALLCGCDPAVADLLLPQCCCSATLLLALFLFAFSHLCVFCLAQEATITCCIPGLRLCAFCCVCGIPVILVWVHALHSPMHTLPYYLPWTGSVSQIDWTRTILMCCSSGCTFCC